ncbi:YqhA family protein [Shewanella sp. D64]|uniref:YqhA family protein n=1 Tax=unclassified Shewanella TaxID=196818 RepID=UPI0022BA67C9|nr:MULTISPECIES: YqhA family protein [unclassified Shewanella]MEC4725531.1 YqhA family protein [Shewanella sp. D64]MEC4738650.1 YqhA family protein [Shewanella sp. E94]WBJ94949.1 YqhA family protein [Shewanella sp. MTB7]
MRNLFERMLWSSRLSVMLGVLACIIAAFVIFVMGLKDVLHMLGLIWVYIFTGGHEIRNDLIMVVVEILDTFLLGAVLLIFAFGLYELFINNLEVAEKSKAAGKILVISSIDSLKSKLGKVILMMLIIKLFSYFIEMKPQSMLELLYMGIIIVLVALSLMLTKDK